MDLPLVECPEFNFFFLAMAQAQTDTSRTNSPNSLFEPEWTMTPLNDLPSDDRDEATTSDAVWGFTERSN